MGVQPTHYFTYNACTLNVPAIGAQSHLVHLKQNSALHWL